ncbi:MAG: hypothetical protein WCF57_09385 [Pyrinomonadaceae bacterium]
MPSRKQASNKRQSISPKRPKAAGATVTVIGSDLSIPKYKTPRIIKGLQLSRFHGADNEPDRSSYKGRRLRLMPNPWLPDDVVMLIKFAFSTASAAGAVYKAIKLWTDDRKARRIIIKKGDFQLEIQGGMSQRDIEKGIGQFRKRTKDTADDDELEVILPKGTEGKASPKRASKKKGGKK